MNGSKVYWDSGLFIAVLFLEERDPEEMNGIKELQQLFNEGKLIICTSVITLTEILLTPIRQVDYDNFLEMIAKANFELILVDAEIAQIAQVIRTFYSNNGYGTITTTDAIHLASSIKKECAVFYTFDGKDKPGKSLGLIPLSGTIAGRYYMEIKKPKGKSKQ